MTKRERSILEIIFANKRLTPESIKSLINGLEKNEITYDQVLKSLPKMQTIISYFNELDYQAITISKILEISITRNASAEQIITINKTFINNNYSKLEAQQIEGIYPRVFKEMGAETLDKKLTLYNDAGVKEDILDKPRRLKQSLCISYSRFEILSERNISLKNGVLFMTELQFKDKFGYWDQDLLKSYPIENSKYYIKK